MVDPCLLIGEMTGIRDRPVFRSVEIAPWLKLFVKKKSTYF